jgi:hypothetical protein
VIDKNVVAGVAVVQEEEVVVVVVVVVGNVVDVEHLHQQNMMYKFVDQVQNEG